METITYQVKQNKSDIKDLKNEIKDINCKTNNSKTDIILTKKDLQNIKEDIEEVKVSLAAINAKLDAQQEVTVQRYYIDPKHRLEGYKKTAITALIAGAIGYFLPKLLSNLIDAIIWP